MFLKASNSSIVDPQGIEGEETKSHTLHTLGSCAMISGKTFAKLTEEVSKQILGQIKQSVSLRKTLFKSQ